jgi:MSHA biogenesis protein MshO
MRLSSQQRRGFTLIELVVAISLTAIVVSFVAVFILLPVRSYNAQSRRAEMVDSADAVLRLMARDIRAALPNSVRIRRSGSVLALEVLNTIDGVRYRSSGAIADPTQELDFASPDGSFATLSQFDNITRGLPFTQYYLSIYNVGVPGADAYSLTNVITPAGTTITINPSSVANEDLITLSPAFRFAYQSPAHRVYLVSGPVTYLCDESANTIRRYTGYPITAAQATAFGAGVSNALVANRAGACQFDYVAGTSQRAGLVTLRVTFSYTADGNTESIWLVHQVHVENGP